MFRFWWQLPGPARFVSNVVTNLREGKNVVLCVPEFVPDGLRTAIRTGVEAIGSFHWTTMPVSDYPSDRPADMLFRRFVPAAPADTIRSADNLAHESSFFGKIIWLENIADVDWPRWKEFLTDYAHVCRSHGELERSVFCTLLVGSVAKDIPRDDVCLVRCYWRDMISRLDMLLFAYHCLQERRLGRLDRELVVHIVANLAGWDPRLALDLSSAQPCDILRPLPLLRELARKRGWLFCSNDLDAIDWYRGVHDTVEGQNFIHTLALVNDDRHCEIDHRVWRAEVAVMLPFVEERRRELLGHLRGVLKLPHKTQTGEIIDNLLDLEIGHICHQLAVNRSRNHESVRRTAQKLRDIRNALSHLEPLQPQKALDPDLQSPFG